MTRPQERDEQFFNTILRQIKTSEKKSVARDFLERFYKMGVEVPYGRVRQVLSMDVGDEVIVGRAYLVINEFKPFAESSLSTEDEPVGKLEFWIRKPEDGKVLIRLTEVSRLIKSLIEVWRSDIQCFLFFVVSSTEFSPLAEKGKRGPVEGIVLELFCEEMCKWLEERKLLTVEG